MKSIFYSIRLFRVRVLWFIKNYRAIAYTTGLYNNELHGPATYKTDGLVTSNNADFIYDRKFSEAYKKASETQPWEGFTLQWRVHVICWFANHVKTLEGDFVECGVNTGAYAAAIVQFTEFEALNKSFYLLDTFDGLDETLVSTEEKEAGIMAYFGAYKDVYERVKKTFSEYESIKIIKGRIPDSLSRCSSEKICFLSIDMNCVAPEIAAINYFWDKLVIGAVVILDDYGFPMHIHQKHAFDEFAKTKNVEILCLPTGQGILFKS